MRGKGYLPTFGRSAPCCSWTLSKSSPVTFVMLVLVVSSYTRLCVPDKLHSTVIGVLHRAERLFDRFRAIVRYEAAVLV